MRLRGIGDRKPVAIDIDPSHLRSGIVIVDYRRHVFHPTPVSDGSESIGLQPFADPLKQACFHSAVECIESGDHITSVVGIQLAVLSGHQRAVFPICRITGKVQFSAVPHIFPAELAENVLLVFHAARNFIVPGRKPDIAVRQTAIPTAVRVQAMAAADAIQDPAFHARTCAMGNVAVNVFPHIIVRIPTLVRASEHGNAQVRIDFR